jgi:hypothetical protein
VSNDAIERRQSRAMSFLILIKMSFSVWGAPAWRSLSQKKNCGKTEHPKKFIAS